MESLMELIKLPFEILDGTQGERGTAYGFLMLAFLAGGITLAYHVLNFVQKVIKSVLQFLLEGFRTFIGLFDGLKRSPKPQKQVDVMTEIVPILDEMYKRTVERVDSNNKKMDKIISEIKRGNRSTPTYS